MKIINKSHTTKIASFKVLRLFHIIRDKGGVNTEIFTFRGFPTHPIDIH